MPVLKVKQNENREDYIKRCMPIEINSGKDTKQSFAICNSEYDNQTKERKCLYFSMLSFHQTKKCIPF